MKTLGTLSIGAVVFTFVELIDIARSLKVDLQLSSFIHHTSAQQFQVPEYGKLLCREVLSEDTEARILVHDDGGRDLTFVRSVRTPSGELLGHEMGGIQSTVRCLHETGSNRSACLGGVGVHTPLCSVVNSTECRCRADVSQLPGLRYQKDMLGKTVSDCRAGRSNHFRVLLIGLGGGAIPLYLRQHCKQAFIESVEVDTNVAALARRLLGFYEDARCTLEINDGLAAVRDRARAAAASPNATRYDFVLVDCFDGGGIPTSCRSADFVAGLLRLLAPGGRVLQNAMGRDVDGLLELYRATFGAAQTTSSDVLGHAGQVLVEAIAAPQP